MEEKNINVFRDNIFANIQQRHRNYLYRFKCLQSNHRSSIH